MPGGGPPALALLEGNGYAVNGYLADCGNGTARKALVIPDGAAASGDGASCSLGGESFEIAGDAVVAEGIRAERGDTVKCRGGRSFKLRASDAAPLPDGTTCEVSDETLFGSFVLLGQPEAEVSLEAIVVDCGDSSALIVPSGTETSVEPIIDGVQLRCPDDRLTIPNLAAGRSSGGHLAVIAGDQITRCEAQLKGRDRQTALFDLTLHEPVECGDGSKCVFVTSTHRSGMFGGLAVADTECNALADGAGLPGSYKAWLSDSTSSPSTRFTRAAVPYLLVDGTHIADDWADLTTCDDPAQQQSDQSYRERWRYCRDRPEYRLPARLDWNRDRWHPGRQLRKFLRGLDGGGHGVQWPVRRDYL